MKYPEDSDSTKTVYTYDSMYRTASVVKNLSDTTALGVSYSYDGDKLSGITTKSTNYGFTYGPFYNECIAHSKAIADSIDYWIINHIKEDYTK